jgi:hypothetical protein
MSGIKWGKIENNQPDRIDQVIIVASGKSAKNVNFDKMRKRKNTYIITVNGSGSFVPFANAWFTLDPWGLTGPQLPTHFRGSLFAAVPEDFGTPHAKIMAHRATPSAKITYLHRLQSHNFTDVSSESAYTLGLSDDPSCINTGNSGYGALNFGYFYQSKTTNRLLSTLPTLFASAMEQLEQRNIELFNVNPTSAVDMYPMLTPDEFHHILDGL